MQRHEAGLEGPRSGCGTKWSNGAERRNPGKPFHDECLFLKAQGANKELPPKEFKKN